MRELSKNLYWFDYLDADEMKKIFEGKKLIKDKVREWDKKTEGKQHGLVKF